MLFGSGGTYYQNDWISGAAIDSNGNVFAAGTIQGNGFPTTSASYDTTFQGSGSDMVVAKFSSDLGSLLGSTYLGASGNESIRGLEIDSSGNIFTASTGWSPYPTTSGSYQPTYSSDDTGGNSGDVAISKLSNDLTTLVASTFVGGVSINIL